MFGLIPGYDPVATAAPGDYFDEADAEHACAFFPERLTHIEGELAGKPFVLERWQQAVVGCLFGWKRTDGYRRYREAFIYVARKNGKTPLAAGIANYSLFCDHEIGALNVCAAGDINQASLLFRHCQGQIDNEPELSKRAIVHSGYGQRAIYFPEENSGFRVISSEAKTKHGGNGHLALVDELHAQPNRDLVDVLKSSMSSLNRRQPLLIYITTADFDRPSICNEKYDLAVKIRDRVYDDRAFLPVIFEATPKDDWTKLSTWRKANPNLGVSKSLEYLERECREAQEIVTSENTFKRLDLNLRTEQDIRPIIMIEWDACDGAVDEDALVGQVCWTGLDLASRRDVAAWVLMFPPKKQNGIWKVLPRLFIPADTARVRERRDRVPYVAWGKQGYIRLTEGVDGKVIDYDAIKAQIFADGQRFDIRGIAADRWGLEYLRQRVSKEGGPEMVEYGQGYRSMSEPTKELLALIAVARLAHGGHPVLRWMASNAATWEDPAGNVKFDKDKSGDKIDGLVAMVMALGLAMIGEKKPPPSIYTADRGCMTD